MYPLAPAEGVPSGASDSTAQGGSILSWLWAHPPHLLRLQGRVELDRLEVPFCLLSSLSPSPHLASSGSNSSPWIHIVVNQGGGGSGGEETYGSHPALSRPEARLGKPGSLFCLKLPVKVTDILL